MSLGLKSRLASFLAQSLGNPNSFASALPVEISSARFRQSILSTSLTQNESIFLMESPDTTPLPKVNIPGWFDDESTHVVFHEGDTLIEDGSYDGRCYVILEGTVEIQRGGRAVAVEGPGSIVGEFSLIDEGPATADVVATSETKAAFLSQERFDILVQQHPFFARDVMKVMSIRMKQRKESM